MMVARGCLTWPLFVDDDHVASLKWVESQSFTFGLFTPTLTLLAR